MATMIGPRARREIKIDLLWCGFLSSILIVPCMHAQQATPAIDNSAPQQDAFIAKAVFDVASIRRFKPDGGPMMLSYRNDPDGLTSTHNPLVSLICNAYGVSHFQVSGGPDWVASDYYDVHAKMDAQTADLLKTLSADQARAARQHMLQALLADRFKLTIHHETRQFPIYKLIVAKGGSKLHEAKAGDDYASGLQGPDGKSGGKGTMRVGDDSGAIVMTAQGISIDRLVAQISGQLGSQVHNETGLKGDYDITLRYTSEDMRMEAPNPSGGGNVSQSDNNGISLFAALEDQLGLKLESQKGPVDVIVIDHVEPPSEN
jgi:uncharacterized protein (TIGR03435 family)